MGLRRKSREIALQFLFAHDFGEHLSTADAVQGELASFLDSFTINQKALPYARELISGIVEKMQSLDTLLAGHSHNWRLERMSSVDRNILRMAVYEMLYVGDVPGQVAINEALEVAKRFSLPDSVAFINGILDAVQIDLEA